MDLGRTAVRQMVPKAVKKGVELGSEIKCCELMSVTPLIFFGKMDQLHDGCKMITMQPFLDGFDLADMVGTLWIETVARQESISCPVHDGFKGKQGGIKINQKLHEGDFHSSGIGVMNLIWLHADWKRLVFMLKWNVLKIERGNRCG